MDCQVLVRMVQKFTCEFRLHKPTEMSRIRVTLKTCSEP